MAVNLSEERQPSGVALGVEQAGLGGRDVDPAVVLRTVVNTMAVVISAASPTGVPAQHSAPSLRERPAA